MLTLPKRDGKEDRASGWHASPAAWEALKPLARGMRRDATPAEEVLWEHLRTYRAKGFGFRRQHVLDRFIVDFYCPRAQLVIELDGGIHIARKEEDRARDGTLAELGRRVLRFSNDEVLGSLSSVARRIAQELMGADASRQNTPEP